MDSKIYVALDADNFLRTILAVSDASAQIRSGLKYSGKYERSRYKVDRELLEELMKAMDSAYSEQHCKEDIRRENARKVAWTWGVSIVDDVTAISAASCMEDVKAAASNLEADAMKWSAVREALSLALDLPVEELQEAFDSGAAEQKKIKEAKNDE